MYNLYLSRWSERQTSEISRDQIEELLVQLSSSSGKTTANRVIQFLRPMFNHGIQIGLIDGPNPASGVKVFRLKSRERFLEQHEITRLFVAIETLRYQITKDFLYMCLFTGARRNNVAAMKWRDISFERNVWTIPETKNGTSQIQPLTTSAIAILNRRRKECNESDFVFPSKRSRTGHLTKPEGAWAEVIERARLTDVHIHDLRRTLASWEALTGANTVLIGATLNHKDPKSTAVYARHNVAAVRLAMETATREMTALTGLIQNFNNQFQNEESSEAINAEPLVITKAAPGYKYNYGLGVNRKGEMVTIPEEIRIIKYIFALRAEGLSLREISLKLNEECLFRRGRYWTKSHIDWILRTREKWESKIDAQSIPERVK
ncbi:MAG: tyrosine-type recombinase/integrase [Candidatus Obscuribacterales bacterium]|nr:tyrosine-type recombinase/integrase [Candidatus Obscuribacterales bacterium]